ncbi:MAG: LamG domain-containing protein [Verrucomicrobiota bacterium]
MRLFPRKSCPNRSWRAISSAALLLALSLTPARAGLKDGLVAYWPLDTVVGTKTPDLVSGYDMELMNLTAADLVDGKVGKAFKFDNARQTMLKRQHTVGEQLPINQYPAVTVTLWAKVAGSTLTDLRLFSEASTTDNNPLFNLGTGSTGGINNLDILFRQTPWATVDHLRTVSEPLDDTWHHIAYIQQADGSRALYIDGVKDDLEIPAKEEGAWRLNTTSIGGILRANPTHWLTGLIDDVALWNRALSEAELKQVVATGLSSVFSPIAQGMVAYWPSTKWWVPKRRNW